MKPLRLEELYPKFLFPHLVWDEVGVLCLHGGVRTEYGFDDLVGHAQLHGVAAIRAVGYCLQLSEEGGGEAWLLAG